MSYGLDYEGDMGMGGGGGVHSPASGGGGGHSQSSGGGGSGRKRPPYDEQTIQSVTISQILASTIRDPSTGSSQLPDGRNLHHVSFIAAVRGFDDNSTHLLFTMEDGTGSIQVKNWLDDNSECQAGTELRQAYSREHIYLKVIGQVKDYDGNKVVLADAIRPLTTANQITHHFLQVVYQSEMHKKGGMGGGNSHMMMGGSNGMAPGFAGSPMMQHQGSPLTNNNHQGGSAAGGGGDEVLRQRILDVVRNATLPGGCDASYVASQLGGAYPENQVASEIDYLSHEGSLYTTHDEYHFNAT